MSNRTYRQFRGHLKTELVLVTAYFVGNATSEVTIPTDDNPYVTSITRSDTGDHDIVWTEKFIGTVVDVGISVVGDTAGLTGRFTALDMAAGTGSITLEVGATATDAATTDTVYLHVWVRNSSQNT
jgi:hypothetical protein